MLKVTDVIKDFDGFRALDSINMHVPKGSVYGLVGPNGAGKSTLIRHITGVYKPDSGSIMINNEPIYENAFQKSKMAYIPDDLFFFLQASTLDMMNYYRGIYPYFDMDRFHKLENIFTTIDKKRPIRRLSKGMQKQSAFWISMCCNPQFIVLDEPVDGLDPIMRRQIWSILMTDVAERDTTVLVSSHNLRELEDVCDYVGIMNKGKVILERSLSELQENITKLQVAFEGELPELPPELNVINVSHSGRIYTLIIKGNIAMTESLLASVNPLLMDALPLTLEEIFIYELGGTGYECKDILL